MRGAEPRRGPAMAAELEAPGAEPSRVAAAQPRRGRCPAVLPLLRSAARRKRGREWWRGGGQLQ